MVYFIALKIKKNKDDNIQISKAVQLHYDIESQSVTHLKEEKKLIAMHI